MQEDRDHDAGFDEDRVPLADTPRASYRLQLRPDFGFEAVAGVAPYLRALGVSHLYLSPIGEARPGSTHGYDVTDHAEIRRELGGASGLAVLALTLAETDLRLLIDIVPNHTSVAVPALNRHWWNTLRYGRAHPSASFFDIDWDAGGGAVLLPLLDRPLDEALERAELTIGRFPQATPGAPGEVRDGDDEMPGDLVLRFGELQLPIIPSTADLPIDELVEAQHYRLIPWRSASRNVRRFFTIDDLVALRTELPIVADEVNKPVRDLRAAGWLDGVRVDHIDGLADPEAYLARLRSDAPEAWLLVEKILAPGERVARSWPVDGTTGYDFIRLVDHLFVDPAGRDGLTALWHEVSGDRRSFADHRREARREVLAAELAPDLRRLAGIAHQVVPDVAVEDLSRALVELCVSIDRYRTYFPSDPDGLPVLHQLVIDITDRNPELADVVKRLTGAIGSGRGGPSAELRTRWQQLTAPVVAKGDEDRAFYRYHRLAALCEVGGDPDRFGADVAAFHRDAEWRAEHAPLSMLAGTTHDTKRSEDVRARLLALAELPTEWARYSEQMLEHLASMGSAVAPADTYLALQTVVGAWPIDRRRLERYLRKATREAAVRTGWVDPDTAYEGALDWLAGVLCEDPVAVATTRHMVEQVAGAGWANSIGQLVLRLTAPGVPDIYQGCETWNLRLVDPDNRVTPDWAELRDRLHRTAGIDVATAWRRPGDGMIKTAILARVLALRLRRVPSFAPGATYRPLVIGGRSRESGGDDVIAYLRGTDVAVAVRRFPLRSDTGTDRSDVQLPPGRWSSTLGNGPDLDGGPVRAAELFGGLPVAVVERVDR